ncbi:MAG TPA: metal-sulfur cluster assembly factor [Thermotogota bacterium]|nr:metal-sulfur cluster assembly factor [Thermotogota bacterium]HPJ88093.1 metal-sulfur cluster assembly factor [Thermotogota bacterium]HPR96047.1 metal-sulfur cluster assembly factor [Thermotogota bacterium]
MSTVSKEKVIEALSQVVDIEIGIDIVSLGLIYKVDIDENDNVTIVMTLTVPTCPMASFMTEQARSAAASVPGVQKVDLQLAFEPRWTPDMMADSAKRLLGR